MIKRPLAGMPRIVGFAMILAVAVSVGWLGAVWKNYRADARIVPTSYPDNGPQPTVGAAPHENVESELAKLRQEIAQIRAEQNRHARALSGIAGYIETEEDIA